MVLKVINYEFKLKLKRFIDTTLDKVYIRLSSFQIHK